jgi:hypothetical protein
MLGMNPLVLYILQGVIIELHGDFIPSNAPLWQALTGFAVVYLVCYVVAVYLYKNKWFVKI